MKTIENRIMEMLQQWQSAAKSTEAAGMASLATTQLTKYVAWFGSSTITLLGLVLLPLYHYTPLRARKLFSSSFYLYILYPCYYCIILFSNFLCIVLV